MNLPQELLSETNYVTNRIDINSKKWQTYIINVFCHSYTTAFNRYQKIIEEQKKIELKRIDLAFSALTLLGGSLLTTALGKTTLKAAVGNFAVDTICNNNMERAFQVAHIVSTNHTAKFIIGEAWNSGTKWITNRTKTVFQEHTYTAPNALVNIEKPDDIRFVLNQFMSDCELRLAQIVDDLYKSKLSREEKLAGLDMVLSSPFCKAPTQKVFGQNLTEQNELCFFMKMILNSDSFLTVNKHGNNPKLTSITELPSSPNYPTKNNPGKYRGPSYREVSGVRYKRIGETISTEVNKLLKNVAKSDFTLDSSFWEKLTTPATGTSWNGDIPNAKILREAERILIDMGEKTIGKINFQLNNSMGA